MVADLAEKMHIPFASVSPDTLDRLATHLDPEMSPANPLDVWGTGRDFEAQVQGCAAALLDDPDTAIGVLFQDVRDGSYIAEGFTRAMIAAARCSRKPVAVVTNYASVNHRSLALRVTEAGVPVVDGTTEGLLAIGQLMEARDRRLRLHSFPEPVPDEVRQHWRRRLASATPLAATEALALLADYKIPTAQTLDVASLDQAMAAAGRLGWPVVLKTAEAAIDHKSESGGVALGLQDEAALRDAYGKMSRLGPSMTLSAMARGRVEIAFGLLRDPQFGPLLMLAAGGILIEALADRAVALPPVSLEEAGAMLSRLRIHRLMGALRNLPAVDTRAAAQAFAQFSLLAQDLGDLIDELDVNPLLVSENGVVAVDALVVTRAQAQKRTE